MTPRLVEHGFWRVEVKGNFKHRLVPCGVATPADEDLTEVQQTLRRIEKNSTAIKPIQVGERKRMAAMRVQSALIGQMVVNAT